MTYRGYTIYRELHGWQRTEINEDGTLGPDVRFTEDDSGSEYFVVCDPLGTEIDDECTSLEEAKASIDQEIRNIEAAA